MKKKVSRQAEVWYRLEKWPVLPTIFLLFYIGRVVSAGEVGSLTNHLSTLLHWTCGIGWRSGQSYQPSFYSSKLDVWYRLEKEVGSLTNHLSTLLNWTCGIGWRSGQSYQPSFYSSTLDVWYRLEKWAVLPTIFLLFYIGRVISAGEVGSLTNHLSTLLHWTCDIGWRSGQSYQPSFYSSKLDVWYRLEKWAVLPTIFLLF
ncbi:hypothetical protein BgiBS90_007390 [Biomphalaria glabrata]|nr:hypothetical protein BgiBS90_007390 [Biomphalaria glabrata]